MHYDPTLLRAIKKRDEIVEALAAHPLDRAAILKMLEDGGVEIEFVALECSACATMLGCKWHIFLDPALSSDEREKYLWHELVRLYLRRIFGSCINDDCTSDYHELIVSESRRLACEKPLSREELSRYIQITPRR